MLGGAGFISSAAVRHIIYDTHDSVINLDKLTYAGNLESLATAAPMMAGLAVLCDSFVAITFGAQWLLVPSILFWLAPTGFVQSLISITGSIFMAHGKIQLLMKLGVLSAILQVGVFMIGGTK